MLTECVKSAHICKCGKLLCTKHDKSDLTLRLNWLWIGVAKPFRLLTLNTFIANKEKYTIDMGPQIFFWAVPMVRSSCKWIRSTDNPKTLWHIKKDKKVHLVDLIDLYLPLLLVLPHLLDKALNVHNCVTHFHICHFWYTIAVFRPVKSTPKNIQIFCPLFLCPKKNIAAQY